MNLWTAPEQLPPEIDLLVRRWRLPVERAPQVRALLESQAEGGTATRLTNANTDEVWGAACAGFSPASADEPRPTPLVRVSHAGRDYLQSWRFFQAERAISNNLRERAARPAPTLTRAVPELVASLGTDRLNARQADAITCALSHSLALITGGPGTGKTHTLARLLAMLIVAHAGPTAPVILLAAPTGKAAERMREAIEGAADRLPAGLPADIPARLKATAAAAVTLHRLLGFNPRTGECAHGCETPLRCDALIVDECSMVDTLQWQALLAALPDEARLVLLGDPNQLESVAAGDVLGSLVRHARAYPSTPLARSWVELVESQRFKARPAIGELAEAVVNLRADAAVELLQRHKRVDEVSGLVWLGDHGGRFAWASLPASVQDALLEIADAPTAGEALAALGRVRLLTAHRESSVGVSGLNAAIARHLGQRAGVARLPNYPIIANRNDADTGLKNGSVGVVMLKAGGARVAYFPASSPGAAPREIPLGQLPAHELAWAMTIHRSQGSEFDQVVVILPRDESPLATRELVYTGITRAKECVHVWGAEASLRAALTPRAARCTLLEFHLGVGAVS